MDLLFDCPACTGPLIAAESERGTPRGCAHCDRRVFVPPGAHRARSVSLLRDSDIMGVDPLARGVQPILRRVRPATQEIERPLIASSARIVTVPRPRLGVPRAA